jgi:hypothetical protein
MWPFFLLCVGLWCWRLHGRWRPHERHGSGGNGSGRCPGASDSVLYTRPRAPTRVAPCRERARGGRLPPTRPRALETAAKWHFAWHPLLKPHTHTLHIHTSACACLLGGVGGWWVLRFRCERSCDGWTPRTACSFTPERGSDDDDVCVCVCAGAGDGGKAVL